MIIERKVVGVLLLLHNAHHKLLDQKIARKRAEKYANLSLRHWQFSLEAEKKAQLSRIQQRKTQSAHHNLVETVFLH